MNLPGIAACSTSDGVRKPAVGSSAGNHPSLVFCPFDLRTPPDGGATVGTSPWHSLQQAYRSFSDSLSLFYELVYVYGMEPKELYMVGASISLSQVQA